MSTTHPQLAASLDDVSTLAIIGTGLLGGSIGLGLRQRGFSGKIIGVSRRKTTLDAALAAGCIDQASTSLAQAVEQSQLAVLCMPVSAFDGILTQIAESDHANLVLTDVGSTKAQVCQWAREILSQPQRFVGSHPMAGGEQHGPTHARADLFDGKPCVICADDRTDPAAKSLVESLWRFLGMKLLHIDAAQADAQAARISHLPHAVAVVLVELAQRLGGLDMASTGFRDTTRVASGDPQIWKDIFASNRPATLEAIDQFTRELAAFRDILSQGDEQAMVELLTRSKHSRDQWLARMLAAGGATPSSTSE